MPGIATADGVFVRQAGRLHKLPRTRQTVTAFVTALIPCPHCGKRFGCDCQDWLEWMLLAEPLPQECIGDAA